MVRSTHKLLCTVSSMIEAELVKQNMEMEGIDAIIFSEKDSSFNFTMGDMSEVFVYIHPDDFDHAKELFEKTQNN
jgi:hypothetical protein